MVKRVSDVTVVAEVNMAFKGNAKSELHIF